MTSDASLVARALQAGDLAVIPTDTVYGLACTARLEEPARRLYALKGRTEIQPTALVAASVEAVFQCLPELPDRAANAVRLLLPGPFTLVLPNPARRFPWLNRARPEAIGVRVPRLDGPGKDVLDAVCVLVATSANVAGGEDPRRLTDVPPAILAGVAATLDGGELPGTPSTVLDLTAAEPAVLRAGAGDAAWAIERLTTI